MLDVVAELDLSRIYGHYEKELRGFPPHDPRMMVALLLYAYCVGVPSSRRIEQRTHEDVAFRVIAAGQHPDHTRISDFRKVHLDALAELYVQVLRLCQRVGLVKLGHVALDGTKMRANASKHKAMSYGRMNAEEKRLREKVRQLLKQAERVDAEEDARYGKNRRGNELPDELARTEARRVRIRELRKALEAEAQEQSERKDDDDPPPSSPSTDLPSHRIPTDKSGNPTDKAQRNFTDPDSRIMKTGDGYVQGYNCQIAVDAEHQIIVAQAVTNQAPDVEHFAPMLEQVAQNCGQMPTMGTADSGYFSAENVAYAYSQGVDIHIPTERWKHNDAPPTVRGRAPKGTTLKQDMTRKLRTKRGRAVYARRKVIAEPPFGQIKAARGLRHFLLRGLAKVRGEWALITLGHNLLKLHLATTASPIPT